MNLYMRSRAILMTESAFGLLMPWESSIGSRGKLPDLLQMMV